MVQVGLVHYVGKHGPAGRGEGKGRGGGGAGQVDWMEVFLHVATGGTPLHPKLTMATDKGLPHRLLPQLQTGMR